ncbi:DNA repair protein RadC [archaeon]|jgi:DNA repair protein RadC|nr:DNA repair protein RadC [archaeon]
MKILDIARESRPRERFEIFGPENLSDAELLAIILRTGNKQENVVDLSNKLIAKHGLNKIFECSIKELQEINGIGKAKAIQLLVINEISKRCISSKQKSPKIKSAKDAFELMHPKLSNLKKEYFKIILLDTKNKVIGIEQISVGILDASIIHPREIFKPAIKNSASRIILIHNHPSGDPTPSIEDLDITRKLTEVGELIGIQVLDHVIIGDKSFWSFNEDT